MRITAEGKLDPLLGRAHMSPVKHKRDQQNCRNAEEKIEGCGR